MLLEELLQVLEMLTEEKDLGNLKLVLYPDGTGEILTPDDDKVVSWDNDEEMTEMVESILEGSIDDELDF